MVARVGGGQRHMATIVIENVTQPGDEVHHGDTVRCVTSGAPHGRNRITVVEYNAPIWAASDDGNGDFSAEFVVGGGLPWNPPGGVGVMMYAYIDDNKRLTDGFIGADSAEVLAPRA